MARKNLINWEREHGFKAKYVAAKLGMAHSSWSNIKSGRANPTYDLLKKFQKEFEVDDVIELFMED